MYRCHHSFLHVAQLILDTVKPLIHRVAMCCSKFGCALACVDATASENMAVAYRRICTNSLVQSQNTECLHLPQNPVGWVGVPIWAMLLRAEPTLQIGLAVSKSQNPFGSVKLPSRSVHHLQPSRSGTTIQHRLSIVSWTHVARLNLAKWRGFCTCRSDQSQRCTHPTSLRFPRHPMTASSK